MARYKVGKNDRIIYTTYDAYFTIIRANGNRVILPMCCQPGLMAHARRVDAFRWEV